MKYKRNEAFRYPFNTPLECRFNIYKVNQKEVFSRTGQALIHDLSPEGAKVSAELNLLSNENDIEIALFFTLHSDYEVRGKIVWQKTYSDHEYLYGLQLLNHKETRFKIIDELKMLRNIHRYGKK